MACGAPASVTRFQPCVPFHCSASLEVKVTQHDVLAWARLHEALAEGTRTGDLPLGIPNGLVALRQEALRADACSIFTLSSAATRSSLLRELDADCSAVRSLLQVLCRCSCLHSQSLTLSLQILRLLRLRMKVRGRLCPCAVGLRCTCLCFVAAITELPLRSHRTRRLELRQAASSQRPARGTGRDLGRPARSLGVAVSAALGQGETFLLS